MATVVEEEEGVVIFDLLPSWLEPGDDRSTPNGSVACDDSRRY